MKLQGRSILAFLLCLVMVLSLLPMGFAAERQEGETKEPQALIGMKINPDAKVYRTDGDYFEVDRPGSSTLTDAYLLAKEAGERDPMRAALPASYNSRDKGYVTPVRNQGRYGVCWAHAALGSVESYMIKHEIIDASDYYYRPATLETDLSEYQLAWYNYTYAYDKLGLLNGDSSLPASDYLQLGSNDEMVTATLMRGTGPAGENIEELAYSSASSQGLGADYAYQYNAAQVSDVVWIPTANMDAVKQAIMDYGAGSISYYHDDWYEGAKGAYCCIQSAEYGSDQFHYVNHGVTLVGWDDNYSRSNFSSNCRPAGNGAWIVKNSWGTGQGDNGYYYISYEDTATKLGTCYFYQAVNIRTMDNIYQYDGTSNCVSSASLTAKTVQLGNTFVASADLFSGEELNAASICTWDEGMQYTLRIYVGSSETNLSSGTLAVEKSGSFEFPGYHTVRLDEGEVDESVYIAPGQRFSVVFELTTTADKLTIPLDRTASVTNLVTWTHQDHPNSSFFFNGAYWQSFGTGNNIRVKGYTRGHFHIYSYQETVEPTCTEGGYSIYKCEKCGLEIQKDPTSPIPHQYTQTVIEPTCTEGGYTINTCIMCGAAHVSHERDPLGHDYIEAVTPATCTEGGYSIFTCSRCQDSYRGNETPANGHDWMVAETIPGCTEPGYTFYRCRVCDYSYFVESAPPTGHSYLPYVTEPTCTEPGYTTYECAFCGDSYVADEVPALGHTPGEPVQENVFAPTCTSFGGMDMVTYCTVCGVELERSHIEMAPAGHSPGEPTRENETAPSCIVPGSYVEVICCSVCGEELSRETKAIPALGHDWGEPSYEWAEDLSEITASRSCSRDPAHTETEKGTIRQEVTLAATADAEGEITYTATFTNPAFETQTVKVSTPKLDPTDPCAGGHDWDAPTYTWSSDNTEVTAKRVCKNDPAHTESETVATEKTVIREASYEEDGEALYTAVFQNPAFETQTKTVVIPKLTLTNPFVDVKDGAYYYDAVLWAVNAKPQVTAGTDPTHFSPNNTCTRAQVVTFLWRAKGEPEPMAAENPFKDVGTGAYYYKAVLWAVENRITSGTSATTFSPNDGCTRAQVVTFLWRTEGEPEPAAAENPFKDVTGGYYYKAVLWAVENKITAGTSKTLFSPNATCTRGQIVTFLYRDFGS